MDIIITGEEGIFYHMNMNKRFQAFTWRKPGEPPEPMVKKSKYKVKTLISVFIHTTCLVNIHAAKKGESIASQCYIENCLGLAFEAVKKEKINIGLREIKLFHYGARSHVH